MREKKLKGCGKKVYTKDSVMCGEWASGDQHFCEKCFAEHYPEENGKGRKGK